jgi:hypothetical protein
MLSAQANGGHCQDTDDAHRIVCGAWIGDVGGGHAGNLNSCAHMQHIIRPCIWRTCTCTCTHMHERCTACHIVCS